MDAHHNVMPDWIPAVISKQLQISAKNRRPHKGLKGFSLSVTENAKIREIPMSLKKAKN